MSGQRNRPGQAFRLGHDLAVATLRGATTEAQAIARKLLEREAADRQRREEERQGAAAMRNMRSGR